MFARCKYLLFFIFIVTNICAAQITGLHTYNINTDNTTSQIYCLKKLENGYLVLGTNNGLFRFDGQNFIPYIYTKRVVNKNITSIAEDENHVVWLGFQNGEIGYLSDNTIDILLAQEGHPAVAITSLVCDKLGTIYFGTAGEGIYYYKNKRFFNINTDEGLSDGYVYDMLINKLGLIAATDRGINIIRIINEKANVKRFSSANGLVDNIVRCLHSASEKNVEKIDKNSFKCWFGMQDKGFAIFNTYRGSQSTLSNQPWLYGQVNSIVASGNQLWIATENKGIVIVSFRDSSMNNVLSVKAYNNGFSKANNLTIDDEGNIWFISKDKLIKTNGARLQNILPIPQSLYEQIHTIFYDKDKNIWVNTNDGLLKFYFDSELQAWQSIKVNIPGFTKKSDFTCIYQDRFGILWLGTMGMGIILLDPATGKTKILKEEHLIAGGSILSVTGKGNEIWISSLGGVIRCSLYNENFDISNPYYIEDFKEINKIGTNYIYNIFIDSKNRVWFATDGRGITMFENGKLKVFNKSNGLKSLVFYSICEDKKGNMWFSSFNDGVYKFNGTTFTHLSTLDGLTDATITSLKVDDKNNVLAVGNKSVNIIDPVTMNISYLDINQGIEQLNTDLNCVAGNHSLFFVTNKGILQYKPTETSLQPKTILNHAQLFLSDIDNTTKSDFSYDENNFSFSYTGISFSHPDKVRYQYKLEGLSNTWTTTKDDNINFPKLTPGNYVFRARSSINNKFDNNPDVSFTFTINRPFWLQWWFILIVILSVAGLLYLYISIREKAVQRWDRIEKEKIQSQFEVLKSQVNPHFLFNSFNTLISVIEDNRENAVEYVEHLSDLYRKIVTYRDKDIITLAEEIDIINDYFFIQKKRFGNSLQFINHLTIADEKKFMIASLTLQLLTENAVKHNAISTETTLTIELSVEDQYLVIKNNVNQKLSPAKGVGMGLQNIQKRYKHLSKLDIQITKTPDFFQVKIPLLTS